MSNATQTTYRIEIPTADGWKTMKGTESTDLRAVSQTAFKMLDMVPESTHRVIESDGEVIYEWAFGERID